MLTQWTRSVTDYVRSEMAMLEGQEAPSAARFARSISLLASAIDATTSTGRVPIVSPSPDQTLDAAQALPDPLCPSCHRPLAVMAHRINAAGSSYDLSALSCRGCGHTLSVTWHTSVLQRFAAYVVMEFMKRLRLGGAPG